MRKRHWPRPRDSCHAAAWIGCTRFDAASGDSADQSVSFGKSFAWAGGTLRIGRAPGAHHRTGSAARFGGKAIVPRQAVKAELQHDLARSRWPAALALDIFEPLEKAAHIDYRPANSGPTALSARRTRCRAAMMVSASAAGPPAAAPAPPALGDAQSTVSRGINCAYVKSARKRSPA